MNLLLGSKYWRYSMRNGGRQVYIWRTWSSCKKMLHSILTNFLGSLEIPCFTWSTLPAVEHQWTADKDAGTLREEEESKDNGPWMEQAPWKWRDIRTGDWVVLIAQNVHQHQRLAETVQIILELIATAGGPAPKSLTSSYIWLWLEMVIVCKRNVIRVNWKHDNISGGKLRHNHYHWVYWRR